jgi:hypothetical protein
VKPDAGPYNGLNVETAGRFASTMLNATRVICEIAL